MKQSMGKLVAKGNSIRARKDSGTYWDGNISWRWGHLMTPSMDEWNLAKGQRKKAKAQRHKEHGLGSTGVCWGGGQGTETCRDWGWKVWQEGLWVCAKAPTDRTMMAKECRVRTNSSCKEDNHTDCGRGRWKRRKVIKKHQHWNRAIISQAVSTFCLDARGKFPRCHCLTG